MSRTKNKVLAVASGGGHWVQLRRVTVALSDQNVVFVSTLPSYEPDVAPARFYCVADGNRSDLFRVVIAICQIAWVLLRERPDVIITTGAACGLIAVRLGRLLGARTLWLDSIANYEQLSLSGQRAGSYADLWLTQWPHLARESGPHFRGAVL